MERGYGFYLSYEEGEGEREREREDIRIVRYPDSDVHVYTMNDVENIYIHTYLNS